MSVHNAPDEAPAATATAPGLAIDRGLLLLCPKRARSRSRSGRTDDRFRLLAIGDAPDYVKDNVHVLGGYRREMSLQQALRTVFMWHNETLNIWSHLLAAACFVALLLATAARWTATAWPLAVFELGATYTFAVSATFHTLLCISRRHYELWRRMDFVAIVAVMFSMFWPFCFYVFFLDGQRALFAAYVAVAAAAALLCAATCLLPVFQTNAFHAARPLVFAALGAWGAAPVVHAAALYWHQHAAVRAAVLLSATQFGLHGIGAVFYASQVPERIRVVPRLSPSPSPASAAGGATTTTAATTTEASAPADRLADYLSSHAIFHVLVFLGLLAFHEGVAGLYRWRREAA
jgi:adiponectin receptor